MTWDELRPIVLALPGTAEGTSYGTPSFRLGKKFLTRLREDGETLVIPLASIDEREALMESEPDLYFYTDHYRDWPSVLVRLPLAKPEHVAGLLTQAWRRGAGKRLLAAYDAGRG